MIIWKIYVPVGNEWVGKWVITSGCESLSENDTMMIEKANKDSLNGNYTVKFYKQGNISGKLRGKVENGVFNGNWQQSNGKGSFEFKISADKKSFVGTYTREDYKGICTWNGKK